MRRFEVGETADWQVVFRGQARRAHALRTARDTEDTLVGACRSGAETPRATIFVQAQLMGEDAVGRQAPPNPAAGSGRLGRRPWRDSALLVWKPPGAYCSVKVFYDVADGHTMRNRYADFECPARGTAIGRCPWDEDTSDCLADLAMARTSPDDNRATGEPGIGTGEPGIGTAPSR